MRFINADYTLVYGDYTCSHKRYALPKNIYDVYLNGKFMGNTTATSEWQAITNVNYRTYGKSPLRKEDKWSAKCMTNDGPKHDYGYYMYYKVFHKVDDDWKYVGMRRARSPEDAIYEMTEIPWVKSLGVEGLWGVCIKRNNTSERK